MKIEERLIRHTQEDIIEIGLAVERFYAGDAGAIFRAMINGRITEEGTRHIENNSVSADRVLGRIEGFNLIRDDIERCIQDMKSLTTPLPE